MRVFEAGKEVGYIVPRAAWFEFVAIAAYGATGIAAKMAEECAKSETELAAKLRKAGLEVK